jgi:hypothetical protein
LQVWAPPQATAVTWNGAAVATVSKPDASRSATAKLGGALPITLPDLSSATWRSAPESPEAAPSFDDASWASATKTTTNSTTKPPAGQQVLTADDYGFHQGDVWYRGRYTGSAAASTVSLRYGGGGAGLLQAWRGGTYLGQDVLPSGVASPATTATAKFIIPAALRTGDHVLSVMVRNDGHNEDGGVNDAQKEGRGLISVTMADASAVTVPTSIAWKIQGNLGGEDIVDTTRGVTNVGGLYGERHGWYLPGYPDQSWSRASVPASTAATGTSWYRTTFGLDIPAADDASLGITIGNPATPRSAANYRALIYVNGWNIGQYIANVGPQHTFVVPNGILDPRGNNTLAIAVTGDGGAGNGLENVQLTDLGTIRGGVPVALDSSPAWNVQTWGDPAVPARVSLDHLSSDAGNPARGGDVITVTGAVRNDAGGPATDVSASLQAPDGWTVSPSDPIVVPSLQPGATQPVQWQVTVPTDAATARYQLAAAATYTQDGAQGSTGATLTVNVRRIGDLWVSDLPFVSATNGYGPVERDMNVGGTGSGDGGPIAIRGVTYAKGLGTNSISSVVLDLGGTCSSFTTDVGIDDSGGGKGTVTFTVLADGNVVASTGVMTGTQAARHLQADVTGAQTLTLQVGDAGDGNGHDNADWAGAELHCTS